MGRNILLWEVLRVSEKPRFVPLVLVPGRPKVSSVSFKLQPTASDWEDIVCVLSNSDTRRRSSINFNVRTSNTAKRWSCTCLFPPCLLLWLTLFFCLYDLKDIGVRSSVVMRYIWYIVVSSIEVVGPARGWHVYLKHRLWFFHVCACLWGGKRVILILLFSSIPFFFLQ